MKGAGVGRRQDASDTRQRDSPSWPPHLATPPIQNCPESKNVIPDLIQIGILEGERFEGETCPKLSIACRRRPKPAPARRPLRTPGTHPAAANPAWGATSPHRTGGRPMGGRGPATSANHVTLSQLDSNGHLLKTVTSNMAAGRGGCAQ